MKDPNVDTPAGSSVGRLRRFVSGMFAPRKQSAPKHETPQEKGPAGERVDKTGSGKPA